ncbi:MAG: hypothetical protein SF182_18925 [Deltaproteobacteria bacterium]|nr:hypothetical protein [Deltaproteobacteria bacterium]
MDIATGVGRERPLRNPWALRVIACAAVALTASIAAAAAPSAFQQSTYFGGGGDEHARKCVFDPSTCDIVCVGAATSGHVLGTAGGAQPDPAGLGDGWVARLSGDLTTIRQATYIGGSQTDRAEGVVIDPASGDIVVAGITSSATLPGLSNAAQPQRGGGDDAFVARFSGDLRTLRGTTYLGGTANEGGNVVGLAIEPGSGVVLVAGSTQSNDFPGTQGGAFGSPSGSFVARLSGDLSTLEQASYVNAVPTQINDVLVHPTSGDIVLGGRSVYPGGRQTGLLTAFAADLRSALGSVDIGAVGYCAVWALAVDPASGDVIGAGEIDNALGEAAAGSAQPNYSGGSDAFAIRVSADLATVRRATYLGGNGFERGYGVSLGSSGEIFVTGITQSAAFPGLAGGAQSELHGVQDGFVVRLNPDLTELRQSTLVGGARYDTAYWLATCPESGDLVLSGYTDSADFPATAGGAQPTIERGAFSNSAGFAMRLGAALTGGVATPTPTPTTPTLSTATPTGTPTVPVTPGGSCVGDCNGDGAVTVNELITGVNIALDQASLSACPSFDSSGDGAVAVNELISAVSNALNGCS